MELVILALFAASLAGCITYSVRCQSDHTPALRTVRGFVVGMITGMGLTMLALLVRGVMLFV